MLKTNQASCVIETRNLCVSINRSTILKNLTFNVKYGEVYALLGGNGAGKSTTLKTLLGFNKPSSGQALIQGYEVSKTLDSTRKNIAYLPESVTLYQHLSAQENLKYFLSLAGMTKTINEINHTLERVALQESAWAKPMQTYSKGMRQKTAIALALLRQAPILLLDEPTSGLDPVAIDELNNLIAGLAQNGTTILMVTHDVYGACQVADRIGLLKDGELVGEFKSPESGCINTEEVHAAFIQQVSL